MRALELGMLPRDSAAALMAQTSVGVADLVLADNGGRFTVVKWRRRQACLREPQALPEHLLSYCLAGPSEATVEVDGERRTLRNLPGGFAFIPAGVKLRWRLEAATETVHLHLYLRPGTGSLAEAPRNGPGHGLHALRWRRDPWIDHYVQLLLSELDSCERHASLPRSRFLDHTHALLLQHLSLPPAAGATTAAAAAAGRGSRVSPLRPALLARIDEHLQAHLGEEVPLAALAALVSMSVDHFVRAFHRATGSTPHQYVLGRRLEHACALLRDSSLQVAEVARECGFASAAHFSSVFHRRHGASPSAFRRRR